MGSACPSRPAVARAAHAGWWILAGCGYAVLLLGLVCTTRWARETAARLGEAPPGANPAYPR